MIGYQEAFGLTIIELRKTIELNRIQLSKRLNISSNILRKYELGFKEPTINLINDLCRIFKKDFDYFLVE